MQEQQQSVHPARWSDVYLMAGARAASRCGDFVAATALVLSLQERGAGGHAVAAVLLAATIPPIVLAPLVGRLVDRLDSRWLLVLTGLSQAVVCTWLAYTSSLAAVVTLLLLLGAGYSVAQATMSALTPDMVGKDNLPRAMAISQTAVSIGLAVAPALGAVMFDQSGLRVPLLLDAVSYLPVAAAGLAIRTRRGGRHRFGKSTKADSVGPVDPRPAWSVRRDALLRPLAVLFATVVGTVSAVNVVDVYYVRETLDASATAFGLLGATWMAGMIAGAAWVGRYTVDDTQAGRLVAVLFLVEGFVIAAAATLASVHPMYLLWLIGGMANGAGNVLVAVVVGRRAPDAVRGRAFATFGAIANSAMLAAYGLAGLLLAVASPRPLMVAAGGAGLLAVGVFAVPLLRASTAAIFNEGEKGCHPTNPQERSSVARFPVLRGGAPRT
jgi:MFS family permease